MNPGNIVFMLIGIAIGWTLCAIAVCLSHDKFNFGSKNNNHRKDKSYNDGNR